MNRQEKYGWTSAGIEAGCFGSTEEENLTQPRMGHVKEAFFEEMMPGLSLRG